ncbi:amino acid ABC transporter substrate-binding protein [Halobacillus amylolyticus]|uniref:Amino acid ABC transporter substrate-binding protein n=1 Tax=Halobacillus amylolyticus TaxID=2932259 RepID=A0ABY4HG53_9BACI|nr:amino acid ABC transporter substrate-binding protein [Halobacillus amylolyticus]UOR13516.1 amino acid ABC transporter substrate-binding protein [Halobacillus amylolyticus]
MKKYAGWMVVSLFIFILAACGSSESDTSGDEAASDQSLYDQIKEEGVLTIGTEGTYAPYTFHNDEDELTGYDVDVAREVAKRMGVEAKFKETKWDAMFAGLNSERFDMIANQVGIKPDREKKYNFSIPYTYTTAVLVTNKNSEEISSFEDLEGKTSAQSLTSNYSAIAKSYGAKVESVEGFNPAMQLLANGRVDATVNDRLSVLDYLNEQGESAPVEIVDKEEDASETAMMFRENNPELVDAVNEALKSMKEDGTLEEISKKWFNEDVSVK